MGDTLAFAATALTTVTAAGSWAAAWKLTTIERHRWHADMEPRLNAYIASACNLHIELLGPSGLNKLDEVTVTVRSDCKHIHGDSGQPGYKFIDTDGKVEVGVITPVDVESDDGWTAGPFQLIRGGVPVVLVLVEVNHRGLPRSQGRGCPAYLTASCRAGRLTWSVPLVAKHVES